MSLRGARYERRGNPQSSTGLVKYYMNIHLIALGSLKESYWREAKEEYIKRLKPYAKVFIHELKEESFDEKSNPEVIRTKEAEKVLKEIEKIKDAYLIVLDENGKQFSSVDFAAHINNRTMEQLNNFIFVIGGPLGLHQSVIKKANLLFSLSKSTLPHQMVRVVLLEQIYRGIMILNNRKYHY